MQLNAKNSLLAIIFIVLSNLVVGQLTFDYLQPALVEEAIDEWEAHLSTVAAEVSTIFKNANAQQWEAHALKLSERYFAEAYIMFKEDLGAYEQDLLNRAQLYQHNSFVDLSTSSVFYVLDTQQLMVLENVYFDSFTNWLSDWVLWLVACVLNIGFLTIFVYFVWSEQKRLSHTIAALNQQPTQRTNSIDDHIAHIKTYLTDISAQNQTQLNLQRDLLHGVAHEFRSPMARMQFALDMLEDADSQSRSDLTKSMQNALQGLDDLVKELLSYARLKDGSTAVQKVSSNLDELAKQAVENVQSFYPAIKFEVIHSELMVNADSNLLNRVFVNLLRNAGRFAKSSCQVSFSQNDAYICCFFEDDGMGIPPGKTDRIFEPFTRLDPSRSRDSGGCGLGLAIASSIAQLHDGKLFVLEKEQGLGGACFCLQLPLQHQLN